MTRSRARMYVAGTRHAFAVAALAATVGFPTAWVPWPDLTHGPRVGSAAGSIGWRAPVLQKFHWRGRIPAGRAIEIKGVNGDVHAGGVTICAVNGSVTLSTVGAAQAETVNGEITSDFPLEVEGRFRPNRLSGTIGAGGRELRLTTVNGNIQLRRSS